MSQIKLLHSGGNGVSIVAPDNNPASDRTLKLPSDGDGTILTTNSSVGKILQVKQTVKTDTTSRGGSSGTDALAAISGLSVDITPSATTSKIYIITNLKLSSTNCWARFQLRRGSTAIYTGNNTGLSITDTTSFIYLANQFQMFNINDNFLDSPNTTSQITYQVYWGARTDSSAMFLNQTSYNTGNWLIRTASSITAMEVAA